MRKEINSKDNIRFLRTFMYRHQLRIYSIKSDNTFCSCELSDLVFILKPKGFLSACVCRHHIFRRIHDNSYAYLLDQFNEMFSRNLEITAT